MEVHTFFPEQGLFATVRDCRVMRWPSPVIIGELLRKSVSAATWLQFLMVPDMDLIAVPKNPENGP